MWRLHAFELHYNEAQGPFYYCTIRENLKHKNPKPRRCNTKSLWAPLGLVGLPTSRGHDLVILSPFDTHDTPLERSL